MLFVYGFFLLLAPQLFEYSSPAMIWNDRIVALLLLFIAILALFLQKKDRLLGLAAIIGLWLELSPLIFWAPELSSYLVDLIVGLALIFLFIFHPDRKREKGLIPPGWSYNPSSYLQRIPVIFLAFICWSLANALTFYQMGYISQLWDPFFGEGTMRVLTSSVSKAWPVSDAGLGAFSYALDAIMGCVGDQRRWCSAPWAVIIFSILVVPLGFVSIVLIILQPVVVGAWCTLCLITAALMLLMVILAANEAVASLQFLKRCKEEKRSLWKAFWIGGKSPGQKVSSHGKNIFVEMTTGETLPWNLTCSAALGVWLMISSAIFSTIEGAAHLDNIMGPLVIMVSISSMAEVIRAFRFCNIVFGAILIITPWFLEGGNAIASTNSAIVGISLIFLTFPRGKVLQTYGSWDKKIF